MNTYMQTRDYGPRAWRSFTAALLLSDQLHTWLPSGESIEIANSRGWLPFSQLGMIDFVEAGVLRIGGRAENFALSEKDAELALHRSSKSQFDNYVRDVVDRQGGIQDYAKVVLHPRYDSAARAYTLLKEGRSSRTSPSLEHPYTTASEIVRSEAIPTPPIVIQRARQFAEMSISKIGDPDIRKAVKYISRYVRPEREQVVMHETFQLMRIAFEHANIMRTHRCRVHFEDNGYTSMLRDIAESPTVHSAGAASEEIPRKRIEDLLGLVDFLLAESPMRSPADLIRRHEKIMPHRKAIWEMVSLSNLPTVSLRNLIEGGYQDRSLLENLFEGASPLDRGLTMTGMAVGVIGCLLWALKPSMDITDPTGIVVAGVQLYRNYSNNANSHYQYGPQWPFLMLYETERPSKEQIKEVLRQLEYRLNRV